MPASGLNSNWHEAVLSLNGARELVPATIEVWERNYRTPEEPLRATVDVSDEDGDRSVFGQVGRSTEFHLTQAGGATVAKTRRERQIARQVTISGTSDVKGLNAGRGSEADQHEDADCRIRFRHHEDGHEG